MSQNCQFVDALHTIVARGDYCARLSLGEKIFLPEDAREKIIWTEKACEKKIWLRLGGENIICHQNDFQPPPPEIKMVAP